jgi:NOL1/NOP2/fmu family ribosome biogenesis protein
MLTLLKKSEKEKILSFLNQRFGFAKKLDYYFVKSGKNKIRIISKDFERIDLRGMKIEILGLYFARWDKNELRLSIEGSQIVGKYARKNVLELDKQQAGEWMGGKNFTTDAKNVEEGFVILKYDKDFLGCGKLLKNKVWSYIPKWRRTKML